nr:uncharacterized protein LOC105710662 isoform X4 [Aotus nancymaae]
MPELTNLCRNSPELRSRVPFTAPRAILMGLGTQACSHMASSAPSCHTISRSCSITSRQEHPSAGFLQWVSEAVRWCQSFLRLHVNSRSATSTPYKTSHPKKRSVTSLAPFEDHRTSPRS